MAVGSKVGERLGRLDGCLVGTNVGPQVGVHVGRLVGIAVGRQLGNSFVTGNPRRCCRRKFSGGKSWAATRREGRHIIRCDSR